MGAKKIKQCKKSTQKSPKHDIQLKEFVKTMESVQAQMDKKLEEISSICLKRECK